MPATICCRVGAAVAWSPALIALEDAAMHEITGQVHWHEPSGFKRAGFGKFSRPKTPYDLFMESDDIPIYRDIGVSKVQNLPLAAVAAHGRTRQLHPAARHRRQMGLLRRRSAGRRRAQSRKAHLRGNLSRRRRPRLDRSLARRRQQAPRLRMAEGLAVLDSRQCHAPHRQCQLGAGAAARRHHRAEPDEPHQQRRR